MRGTPKKGNTQKKKKKKKKKNIREEVGVLKLHFEWRGVNKAFVDCSITLLVLEGVIGDTVSEELRKLLFLSAL